MAVTLAGYVKAGAGDTEYVDSCAAEAAALVTLHIGAVAVPANVKARAELEVGADLFYRRSTRNGVASFDDPDVGGGVRINRDPMAAAYPVLRPYLGPGLAG